jgi:hypothetical protein
LPGVNTEINVDATRVTYFLALGSVASLSVALIVGRGKCATKTNQTMNLTICVSQLWEMGVFGQGIKYICDEVLIGWDWSCNIKNAFICREICPLAFLGDVASSSSSQEGRHWGWGGMETDNIHKLELVAGRRD